MTPQQPYFPPASHGFNTIWRSKEVLVMTKQAVLPYRCIKCNEPAGDLLKRKLQWHHPALYLLILISILVYAIIAMVVRKTATINVGLCEEHLAARARHLKVTWALGLLCPLALLAGIYFDDIFLWFMISVGLLIAAVIYGNVTLRVVVPTRIDDYHVWIKGVDANYLQEFPEWQGRA